MFAEVHSFLHETIKIHVRQKRHNKDTLYYTLRPKCFKCWVNLSNFMPHLILWRDADASVCSRLIY